MSEHDRDHTPASDDVLDASGVAARTLDEAKLAGLRQLDVEAVRAAERAALEAGVDPADPWVLDHLDSAGPPQPAEQLSSASTTISEIPEFDPDVRGTGYVYRRLADHLAARIQARELAPGTRLPAERDLARQYGVSIGTVRRVAAELQDRQLILVLPAKGTYVR